MEYFTVCGLYYYDKTIDKGNCQHHRNIQIVNEYNFHIVSVVPVIHTYKNLVSLDFKSISKYFLSRKAKQLVFKSTKVQNLM